MGVMASQITSFTIVHLNRLSFRHRSKKTSKLCATGLCVGNSPVTGESPHKWPVTGKCFHLMTSSCANDLIPIQCYHDMKIVVCIQLSLSFVPVDPINNTTALVQVVACHQSYRRQPLPELMLTDSLTNYQLRHLGLSLVKFVQKLGHFQSRKSIRNCRLQHIEYLVDSQCVQHDNVIKWNHFPHYWPFVRGIHRSPVNSPHKGQWRGALMFSLICAWIKGWVAMVSEAGDWRRHRTHYDVTVMK